VREATYATAACPLTNSVELHLEIEFTKVVKEELDKKRDKNDPCAKGIKKQLKFFVNLTDEYFDDLFDKAFENCDK
jgi:hypothetical protein